MTKSSEHKKFRVKRRDLVSFLRSNHSHLESLSPAEVLKKFAPTDDQLKSRLTNSLLGTGWLRKDQEGLMIFCDGDLDERLALSTHQEKFGRTCPVCQKPYGKNDRINQNTFAKTFGICRLCYATTLHEALVNPSQALAKILVVAAANGVLLNGRNSCISVKSDNESRILGTIDRLAEIFANLSNLVSADEIKESATFRLNALRQKEDEGARKEQKRLEELSHGIDALAMEVDYEILDGAVSGKTYLIKIWIDGYGKTFIEGSKCDIIRTLSDLMSQIKNARFRCPACQREYKVDGSLRSLTSCGCGTSFQFAQLQSSTYKVANPHAAFDPWPWLIAEIKAKISQTDEINAYHRALYSGVSVENIFDGAFVADVPLSNFPCYAISKFVRPKPFASLSPDARCHVVLSAMTQDINVEVWEDYGQEQHIVTYRLHTLEAFVDGTDQRGIFLIALHDSEAVDWLDKTIVEMDREELDDWYHSGRYLFRDEPPGELTSFFRKSPYSYVEGWGLFIKSEPADSLETLKGKIAAAAATLPDKAIELLNTFAKWVRD